MVVLINGGQVAIEWIKANVNGILEAFYPGELGGDAIVDVLVCAHWRVSADVSKCGMSRWATTIRAASCHTPVCGCHLMTCTC